jgi:hypothetical protein
MLTMLTAKAVAPRRQQKREKIAARCPPSQWRHTLVVNIAERDPFATP